MTGEAEAAGELGTGGVAVATDAGGSEAVTGALIARMERLGVSRSELARRLGTSPAYVTKILRGDTNFTLSSLAKIAEALGSRVELRLAAGAEETGPGPATRQREPASRPGGERPGTATQPGTRPRGASRRPGNDRRGPARTPHSSRGGDPAPTPGAAGEPVRGRPAETIPRPPAGPSATSTRRPAPTQQESDDWRVW
jgi:transcriptional regulator with XRE-family HTH domain